MNASEGIANFAEIVGIVVPIAGLYLVWLGLSTWREKNIWEADNDLAKRLLFATFRLRDSLNSIRNPFLSFDETALSDEEKKKRPEAKWSSYGESQAYIRRTDHYTARRSDLEALLVEAEAHWGLESRAVWEDYFVLERELFRYLHCYVSLLRSDDDGMRESYRNLLSSKREILYKTGDDEDQFDADLKSALQKIEASLRKSLGRKK